MIIRFNLSSISSGGLPNKKAPNSLKAKLANKATSFEENIIGIMSSVFESEFKVNVTSKLDNPLSPNIDPSSLK